jgi:hypothetical protein
MWQFDNFSIYKETPVIEFRLIYDGELKSGRSADAKDKQKIRQKLHYQLVNLWNVQQPFKGYMAPGPDNALPYIQTVASNYERNGIRIAPAVNDLFGTACGLEILFLRVGSPGGIFGDQFADIDNRLKTLFDALKMPHDKADFWRRRSPMHRWNILLPTTG